MYARKPRILQDLRHEIEISCAAVPPAAIQVVCHCYISLSTMHWG